MNNTKADRELDAAIEDLALMVNKLDVASGGSGNLPVFLSVDDFGFTEEELARREQWKRERKATWQAKRRIS